MKTLKSLLLLSSLILAAVPAFANAPKTILTYRCEVIVFADDIETRKGEWTFTAPENAGNHGGDQRVFREGVHEILVMADARWMTLAWSRAGKKIAQGQFVMANMDRALARVVIMQDPSSETGEQVSMDCGESLITEAASETHIGTGN